jgi:hypothetical protein
MDFDTGERNMRLKIAAGRYTEGLPINELKYTGSQTYEGKRVI